MEFMINNRYKVGYWHEEEPTDSMLEAGDSIVRRTYIPVSSFIWTLDYTKGRHVFDNTNMSEGADFWENFYLSRQQTHDATSYHSIKNTLGVSLLEGFHKYAKFGLAAYATYEMRRYTQNPDSIPFSGPDRPDNLTPYPLDSPIDPKGSQNLLWVGGQLTKQRGSILRYEANARFGVVGDAAGDILPRGRLRPGSRYWATL